MAFDRGRMFANTREDIEDARERGGRVVVSTLEQAEAVVIEYGGTHSKGNVFYFVDFDANEQVEMDLDLDMKSGPEPTC